MEQVSSQSEFIWLVNQGQIWNCAILDEDQCSNPVLFILWKVI